jgi:murein DD-endopeptidase MepM/ murein hydrolase activator NlpD
MGGRIPVTGESRWADWRSRASRLFRDHEIFVRTGGEVRFLRVSARAQKRAAWIAGSALGAWALATVGIVGWQAYSSWQNSDIIARQQAVAAAEARVEASRAQVQRTAGELGARQDAFEAMFEGLGSESPRAAPAQTTPAAATAGSEPDELSELQSIGTRQARLVAAMNRAFAARSARAEEALRKVGINPAIADSGARGGPLVPAAAFLGQRDPAMRGLIARFTRMQQLEQLVLALPSLHPAHVERMSSGFGFRRDPISGGGAMHAGLDFTGAHGSPIMAAAPGRVSFAGRQGGYGNTIEIDHGHGIMTRYAHLSGLTVRAGQAVSGGQQVGRMGSTGRSTGTHLHFEVRVNGTAVNPRRFLEGNADVLEIQAGAGRPRSARITAR